MDVATGGRFNTERFPPKPSRVPQSPGEKIDQIGKTATATGMPGVVTPLRESWNREFRNAIFHADYSLHGDVVRTVRPIRDYTNEEVTTLVNRSLAYHAALSNLYQFYIASYKEPKEISVPPWFSKDPQERAVVIVRKGYGATGLKDGWTPDEIKAGKIPFRLGRFTPEEDRLLNSDRTIVQLPPNPAIEKVGWCERIMQLAKKGIATINEYLPSIPR